jgi:hypothetical protein
VRQHMAALKQQLPALKTLRRFAGSVAQNFTD